MKEASKTMYTIGKVFMIIDIVTYGLLLIAGIIMRIFALEIYENMDIEYELSEIENSTTILWILSLVFLLIVIVLFIISINVRKRINYYAINTKPHIIMIVIGAFCNIFYLLGGIFGLVSEKNHKLDY